MTSRLAGVRRATTDQLFLAVIPVCDAAGLVTVSP